MKDEKTLVSFAEKKGADLARLIDVEDIVIDPRVRMKCWIPLCKNYRNNLMCPPFLLSVEKFKKNLERYENAIIVQVVADVDSLDKKEGQTEKMLREGEKNHTQHINKLHEIVNILEAEAFKRGFYLATGLIGGTCNLCDTCVAEIGGEKCKHPHLARPSMEAVGIDVQSTCEGLGIPLHLSSSKKVRWTGLVLLE